MMKYFLPLFIIILLSCSDSGEEQQAIIDKTKLESIDSALINDTSSFINKGTDIHIHGNLPGKREIIYVMKNIMSMLSSRQFAGIYKENDDKIKLLDSLTDVIILQNGFANRQQYINTYNEEIKDKEFKHITDSLRNIIYLRVSSLKNSK